MSLKILLNGAKGRMGQTLLSLAPEFEAEIVAAVDIGDDAAEGMEDSDVVIDFSFHEATFPLLRIAAEYDRPVVIGTTGHTDEERETITALTEKLPVVWAGNFSIGVNLLLHLTEEAATILGPEYEAEIIDIHHRQKVDAPSGTAEGLIEVIRQARRLDRGDVKYGRHGIVGERPQAEIGVHSLRCGDLVGEHTILFAGSGERIELIHRATDRKIFAQGAFRAAHWVANQEPGLYSMREVLGLGIQRPPRQCPAGGSPVPASRD